MTELPQARPLSGAGVLAVTPSGLAEMSSRPDQRSRSDLDRAARPPNPNPVPAELFPIPKLSARVLNVRRNQMLIGVLNRQ